jgi:hypothetical protein
MRAMHTRGTTDVPIVGTPSDDAVFGQNECHVLNEDFLVLAVSEQ